MRVAIVDCGTNTIRLLVADVNGSRLSELDRRMEIVRLGEGVDEHRQFRPEALERVFAATRRYAEVIDGFDVDAVRFLATSASRDATNSEALFAGVQDALGVRPDIISGDDEARLSFVGALTGVPVPAEPVLVVDIGGGSTELVLGAADGTIHRAVSLDMGSVRLRERFLRDDPPTPHQVLDAVTFVEELLDTSGVDLAGVATFIGVAGTVTSLSAAHQELPTYQRERVHGSVLTRDELGSLASKLLTSPVELIKLIPSMHPLRAEVIAGGALIASSVAERVGEPMIVSETDILDGAALELGAPDGS